MIEITRLEYAKLKQQEKAFLHDFYQTSCPEYTKNTPPTPDLAQLEVRIFPPRTTGEQKRPFIAFREPQGHRHGGGRAYNLRVEGLMAPRDSWVQLSQGGRGVPNEPRFEGWQQRRGIITGRRGTLPLPFGKHNGHKILQARVMPAYLAKDGRVYLRFFNQMARNRVNSAKVGITLDVPLLDEHRTLKRKAVPVKIADALEQEDWIKVMELARKRI